MKKWRVTFSRKVTESVTINVEARSKSDAIMAAAVSATQEQDWSREVEDSRVGKVERVEEPKGDPMDVPPLLKRTAT